MDSKSKLPAGIIDPSKFSLPVDGDNKATTIVLWDFSRPHMRAFHCAWYTFFLAFIGWFCIPPLLTTIRVDMGLCSNGDFNTLGPIASSICVCGPKCRKTLAEQNGVAIAGTIIMRLLIGNMSESWGPRFCQSFLLFVFSIPLGLSGLSQTMSGLTAARFFISGMGATFVVTQYWTSGMFSKNVVGSANAITAGWGNLGAGAANAIMPAILVAFERTQTPQVAWRIVPVVPAAILMFTAVFSYLISDDAPLGQYKAMYASGDRQRMDGKKMFLEAFMDPRVWCMFMLYGGCFGTELVLNNQLHIFFHDYFHQSRQVSGLAAAIFGILNLVTRPSGGIISDVINKYFGHRGRHWWFFFVQFCSGVSMIGFGFVPPDNFGLGIFVIVLISVFVEMACGACYAIVPYIGAHLKSLGPVSGIVGAGGNVGGVIWSFAIHGALASQRNLALPYTVHGCAVIGTALLLPFVHYKTLGSMFLSKTDFSEDQPDGTVPARVQGSKV